MKKLIVFLLLLLPMIGFSQLTTINPDTVCYQTAGSVYEVTNVPGYTYTWTVNAPGVLVSGQGTNNINVNWSAAAPGLIPNAISVYATNAGGCQTPTVTINVFILNIVPTIVAMGPYCETEACVVMSGTPLGGAWSGTGITGNQFCPANANTGNNTITYTVIQAGCTFTATTVINVSPSPTISPISHN
jgi:hypothetical protein